MIVYRRWDYFFRNFDHFFVKITNAIANDLEDSLKENSVHQRIAIENYLSTFQILILYLLSYRSLTLCPVGGPYKSLPLM